MQPFFQSTFLQALGLAIANSLWQTAVVWMIFMCVNSLSLSSSVKYRFAVAAQFTSFIWFIITLQFYYTQYSQSAGYTPRVPGQQNIQSFLPANSDFSLQLGNLLVRAEQLLPYVSLAYLLLMLFLCMRWFLGYRQTQLIRGNGLEKIPVDWRLFVKRIAAQLGIKKDIRLFLSATVTTPMTIGFLKPVILIPIASINHLTTHQLEAVILHELAHIKRYDYLVNMILSVAEIGLFFNPFTQLLSKSIRKERENSCDDWVLQFQYTASVYAEALLRIAYLQTVPTFAMAAGGKQNDLLARVKRMIDKKDNRFNYRKQLLALMIVTGILSSVAWLNPIASSRTEIATDTKKSTPLLSTRQLVTAAPVALRTDNPLFNPVFFLSEPLQAEMKKSMASARKELEIFSHAGINGHTKLMESIPTVVADALEQASFEMAEKNKDLEQEMAKMEFAKINLEKAFRFDSASLLKTLSITFKEDFAKSLKAAEKDFAKAKIEMNKTLEVKAAININAEKIRSDVQNALDELKKLDLEKLVNNALNLSGLLLEENNHRHSKSGIAPGKRETMKLRRPQFPNKIHLKEKTLPEEKIVSEDEEAETPFLNHAVFEELVSMPHPDTENPIQMDLVKINRIKYIIRQLEILHAKSMVMPIVFRERKSEDKKMTIPL